MTTFDKIRKSKEGINNSQSLNVTYELHQLYFELIKRIDDKPFQANIFVQIVSANESFFKESIASLINFNSKYLQNSKTLVKRIGFKFELDDFFHIAKSNISVGDLIAYSLKYSSIESILRTFQDISELDILNQLNEVEESIINDDIDPLVISESRPLDKNRIIKNLKEVYEIRNIICHDFLAATHKLTFEIPKLIDYLLDTILLQNAVVYLCSDKIYSTLIPIENEERIEYFKKIVSEKTTELSDLYRIYEKDINPRHKDLFKDSINAFDNYLEVDSKFISCGESMFIDLGLENKIQLLDQRIKNMKDEIKKTC
jgi:hypothetical protein